MKSYYQHLKSTQEFGENQNLLKKPILRSSAIFPVIHNESFSSSIHFLGYWLLKRNILEVTLIITLRDANGKTILRKTEIFNDAKAYSINLHSLLKEINQETKNFLGSIEIEFHTTRDMVFPYPALVLEYHNDSFNTCVHTLGRIYNDLDDLKENNETQVPETGFDIHENNDLKSFLSFVNGPIENNDGIIQYTVTNHNSQKHSGTFHIGKINAFETKLVFLNEHIKNLSEILDNHSGSISIRHNFEGFYPRLLVGNKQISSHSISFTHSYYDCNTCTSESDYWSRVNEKHHDSSVYVPIFNRDNEFTNLMIYPNLSPSNLSLKIDLYDQTGQKISESSNFLKINSNEQKLLKIDLTDFCSSLSSKINGNIAAHIISTFDNNKIPSRIKFGLNVGTKDSIHHLPCNICFNMKMGNPLIENKPGSFHWAPILCKRNPIITLGNFSTLKNYTKDANVELNFYRSEDSSHLTEKITLPPNSEKRFSINDFGLNQFLKTEGWVTVKADNPYIQGFYFNFNNSGSVAGDHFF